jgi:hypothetical protein
VVFGEFAVTHGEIYYGVEEFWWEVCGVVHFIVVGEYEDCIAALRRAANVPAALGMGYLSSSSI